jgi:acyl-CoA thioester hydrolase
MGSVSVTIPVLWGDMDALGHVNNARYFRWLESARIALFERIGLIGASASRQTGVGPILATTSCDFLIPVHYPGSIRTDVRVTRVGETSMTMEYEIRDAAAADRLYAKASSVVVLVDYTTMQKVRVPDEMRKAIEVIASGS